jgi:hypothetical protein
MPKFCHRHKRLPSEKMAHTANILAARPGAAQSIEHEDATSRHKIAKGHLRRAFNSADHGSKSEQSKSEQSKSEQVRV